MPNDLIARKLTLTMPMQVRAAEAVASTVDADARTVGVVWTTGARVARRSAIGSPYLEELDTSPGAVRLGRLNSGAPVLDSHRSYGLDSVIGVVEPGTATIKKGEGRATIRFARDDERADTIWRKVQQGIIRAVSVGYRIHKMVESKAKDGSLILRAVDWEPYEISFVAVGADADAGVRAEGAAETPCEIDSQTLAARAASAAALDDERARARDAGFRAACEAARRAVDERAIAICEAVDLAGGTVADAYRFIERHADISEVRAALGMRTQPSQDPFKRGMGADLMRRRFNISSEIH